MKIVKFYKFNKILNLKLLRNKIYEKKQNKLNKIKLQLKKNFQIFFKFSLLNKKILFFGVKNNLIIFFLTSQGLIIIFFYQIISYLKVF